MNLVFETMGTVAALDVRGAQLGGAQFRGIRESFDRWEDRFSLYRPASELSRVVAAELQLTAASEQLREVYALALDWRARTDGNFTPNRPDGVIDLDGLVKALAIAAAGRLLADFECRDWSLNVGGDVLVAGEPRPGARWAIGIVDPVDRSARLCAVELRSTCAGIATSGTAERGEHVWRTEPAGEADLVQVTVMADDIVTADVLATAILAGGAGFRDSATLLWPIDVITVTRSGVIAMTPGARAALAR